MGQTPSKDQQYADLYSSYIQQQQNLIAQQQAQINGLYQMNLESQQQMPSNMFFQSDVSQQLVLHLALQKFAQHGNFVKLKCPF